jgi:hypothetical protein
MAGLVPAIHALAPAGKTWMGGTNPRQPGLEKSETSFSESKKEYSWPMLSDISPR